MEVYNKRAGDTQAQYQFFSQYIFWGKPKTFDQFAVALQEFMSTNKIQFNDPSNYIYKTLIGLTNNKNPMSIIGNLNLVLSLLFKTSEQLLNFIQTLINSNTTKDYIFQNQDNLNNQK